jgi:hypothetical protein
MTSLLSVPPTRSTTCKRDQMQSGRQINTVTPPPPPPQLRLGLYAHGQQRRPPVRREVY